MFVLLFLPLAAVVAAACFYYAYHWLKTPFLWNVLGAVCAFLAVFSLGGAHNPSTGPLAYMEDQGAASPYVLVLQFFGLTVLSYIVGYVIRAQAVRAGYVEDDDDAA